MKKSTRILIGVIVASCAVGITSTLAWLVPVAKFSKTDTIIDGTTEGAFYAYGDGSAGSPFGITQPRHLYNLSWLQYLGKYDGGQYYFEIADDITEGVLDMEGWVLPPIGTEDHPFIGNFNGNGNVINNCTTSNDFGDFARFPSLVNGTSFNANLPQVVGFFGVVGDLNGNVTYGSYNSAINEFKNTGLSNVTVTSAAYQTLIGAAAGYSDGVISNIAIETPIFNIEQINATAYNPSLTTNLSDYGVVGYTENIGEISRYNDKIYGVNVDNVEFIAAAEGSAQGWGGSVDMFGMYTKLDTIWKKFKSYYNTSGTINPFQYYANKEITIEKDSSITINSETNLTNNRLYGDENGTFSTPNTYNHAYYGYKQNDSLDGNKETASYTYLIEEASGDEAYMQLTGKKEVTIVDGQTLKTNYYNTFYGNKIYKDISSVRYYLKVNGTSDVTATTTESEASLWKLENDTIYTSIDDVLYYLNISGTTSVNIGTTSTTAWYYNSTYGGYYTTYNSLDYYLNCSTTDWNLTLLNAAHVLLSDGNGHYITHPSTNGNAGTGSDPSNNQAWWYVNGSYYMATPNGTFYLRNNYYVRQASSTTTTQNMYVSNNTNYRFYLNGNYLYTTYVYTRTHYIYAYFDGSSWRETVTTFTTPPANRTPVIVTNIAESLNDGAKNITFSAQSETPSYYKTSITETVDTSIETYHTFFPLREKDSAAGVPDDTNTGYVVSGANYWGDPYGDIRVSRYAKSGNLSTTCYSNGTLNTVYTINSSNARETVYVQNFKKYEDAKAAMEDVLDNDTNIYGLHFMAASINYGGTDPVIAEKAVINGDIYEDYELPTDSIDFHLKEKGFINFFAGTYFPSNNCFFSLHQVERSGNSISAVKEIDGIYEDLSDVSGMKSYVYKFTDGKYSVPFIYSGGEKFNLDGITPYVEYSTQTTLPSGYTLSFATSRIKVNTLVADFAYYFEIPMNEGEYCLGSVSGSGSNGAYLMYLDIAGNASKTQRTILYEHFEEIRRTFVYPLGVAIVEATTVSNGVVDPTDTANVVIKANYSGALTITRVNNEVTLARASGMTDNAEPTLIGELMWDETYQTYNIHDPGGTDNLTDEIVCQEVITDIMRLQYYDYNVNKDELVITIITDISTDGTNYTRTLYQEIVGGAIYDDSQADLMKIYNHESGAKYSVLEARNQSTILTYDSLLGVNEVLMIHLYYMTPNGIMATMDIYLGAIIDEGNSTGQYYMFNDYLLEISLNSGSITIIVLETGTGTVMIGETVLDQIGETVVISYVAP